MANNLKREIIFELKKILDPELSISLWDLGLIYKVSEKKGKAEVLMTLTSVGCPLFGEMETEIKEKLGKIKGVEKVFVNLTFDPPWNPDKISKEGKKMLSFRL